jgi:uncharacterized membrane protein YdjX (TVP38/TMEM64 family)
MIMAFLVVLIGCVVCTMLAFLIGRNAAIKAAKATYKRGERRETSSVQAM